MVLRELKRIASGSCQHLLKPTERNPHRQSNTLDVKERERRPVFPEHVTSREGSCTWSPTFPSDNPRPHLGCPDFTEARQLGGPVDVIGTDVHQQKLILIPVDDFVGDGG
jgi:hypothetical protein